MSPQDLSAKKNLHSFGIIYVLAIVIFGAITNYLTWTEDKEITLLFLLLLAIVILYLPLIVFTQYADWKINEFGFVLNGFTTLLFAILLLLCVFSSSVWPVTDLQFSLIEAVARTGEELFFRGFLYTLVLRLLTNNNGLRSHIWAILLSSLAFALVHTQTFLPENNTTMFQIFLFACFLASVRLWSGSILPGIILHILINTGELISVMFGCAIYGLFVFWSYRRGEVSLYSISIR